MQQFGAKAARFDPDNGVDPRVIGPVAVVYLDSDEIFLELIALAGGGLLDRETGETG